MKAGRFKTTVRKEPRQARAQATVGAILEATVQILDREGLEAATMAHIAEVAGVSVGSIYQYFSHRDYGARSTGVTLSQNQTAFGNARIERAGLAKRAHIECRDYREIPVKTYDRIVSLEMVEHVGLKRLGSFFQLIAERLKDDGLFFLQFAGLRRGGGLGVAPAGLRPEDMIWGLFMNKYVFPGADASPPLSTMLKAMERAGFGIHSVENISIHYSLTIRRWHENWQRNAAVVQKAYGERWYRLWNFFLAWSWRIGAQGNSECFQVVAHKNLDGFDRKIFLPRAAATQRAA